MRLIICISIFSFFIGFESSFSQSKRDYIWTIGDNNSDGNYHPDFGGVNINFNEKSLKFERIRRLNLSFYSNSSSIADQAGNLAFYTDGCFVYNADNELIENGDSLNHSEMRDESCTTGSSYFAGNASTILLPAPGNNSEYYLIHQRVEEVSPNSNAILLYEWRLESRCNRIS